MIKLSKTVSEHMYIAALIWQNVSLYVSEKKKILRLKEDQMIIVV